MLFRQKQRNARLRKTEKVKIKDLSSLPWTISNFSPKVNMYMLLYSHGRETAGFNITFWAACPFPHTAKEGSFRINQSDLDGQRHGSLDFSTAIIAAMSTVNSREPLHPVLSWNFSSVRTRCR